MGVSFSFVSQLVTLFDEMRECGNLIQNVLESPEAMLSSAEEVGPGEGTAQRLAKKRKRDRDAMRRPLPVMPEVFMRREDSDEDSMEDSDNECADDEEDGEDEHGSSH